MTRFALTSKAIQSQKVNLGAKRQRLGLALMGSFAQVREAKVTLDAEEANLQMAKTPPGVETFIWQFRSPHSSSPARS